MAGQSLARLPRQVHANARTGGGARRSRSRGGSVRRAAYQQTWGPLDVDGLERTADAEEITRAVPGLASDDFPYLTGASAAVDGGSTAGREMIRPSGT
ncbi:hypothetical protein QR97_34005 [Streptomyces sp. PBH53]|nr:hypothetical protein QR97_34005 [Streptomyces sp. PBH53]